MLSATQSFTRFPELPPELRLQIWEVAFFDMPSRVCPVSQEFRARPSHSLSEWIGSDGLVVFDSPTFRHVCRESRQVALQHSAAAGWAVPGSKHPYRAYIPHVDVLYVDDLNHALFFGYHGLGHTVETVPSSPVRLREACHIAISPRIYCFLTETHIVEPPPGLPWPVTPPEFENFRMIFPHLETITIADQGSDQDTPVRDHCRSWQLPMHPCVLDNARLRIKR